MKSSLRNTFLLQILIVLFHRQPDFLTDIMLQKHVILHDYLWQLSIYIYIYIYTHTSSKFRTLFQGYDFNIVVQQIDNTSVNRIFQQQYPQKSASECDGVYYYHYYYFFIWQKQP